jgi:hypothetical protein
MARGMCASCYTLAYRSPRNATCHPERPHRAQGLCRSCYMVWYYRERGLRGPLKKPRRQITECPHVDREYRARGRCGPCHLAILRQENPTVYRIQVQKVRMKKYGLTIEGYAELWKAQGGRCANRACGTAFPLDVDAKRRRNDLVLHIDHDHATGVVRGLLCQRCNTALGQVDDDPNRLLGLVEYLSGAGRTATTG